MLIYLLMIVEFPYRFIFMDITIRRNERCIVGLPSCDFVFSSTRTCFIAYGFEESQLEMSLLRKLLSERSVETIEAGSSIAPGQNAFCAKICSKIITAQFCIILLNTSEHQGQEVPNANVNMEYGLMLGFNKYVIPFQRESQKLPFNVAGLDTVKYTQGTFEKLAIEAIDHAIAATQQSSIETLSPDQNLETFLMTKGLLVSSISEVGEKNINDLGKPLGFSLLHDFGGNRYFFFGNFTMLRTDAVIWRLHMLEKILQDRASTLPSRIQAGFASPAQGAFAFELLTTIQVWVLVTGAFEKVKILEGLNDLGYLHTVEIFTLEDVSSVLTSLPGA